MRQGPGKAKPIIHHDELPLIELPNWFLSLVFIGVLIYQFLP